MPDERGEYEDVFLNGGLALLMAEDGRDAYVSVRASGAPTFSNSTKAPSTFASEDQLVSRFADAWCWNRRTEDDANCMKIEL